MVQQAWYRPDLPAHYCYPTHGKRLAQCRDCRILRRCSVSPNPQLCRCPPERRRAPTWEKATLRVEWALTPRGHISPWDWYIKATASTIQWASLCLETAFPFCWPLWQTKSCSELDLPPPRAVLACSPPDRRRAWWGPWAYIEAGVSRQCESRPAWTQGTLRLPKTLGGPRPFWWKWTRSGALY